MSGLRERLERLRAQSPEVAAESIQAETTVSAKSEEHLLHADFRHIGVELKSNENGQFLLRRIVYPFPYRHGRYELAELREGASHLSPIAMRQNQNSEPIDANKLLFLDTETTGLGVGTGNVPFMVGFGYYTERAFVVEQTLIRHPGEEKAMLSYLLGHMKDKSHLVTYNGRTFDWPVLVNRFILNGWRRSGPEPGHLDFLHPSRALWRNTLPSCRLSIVEEERLGIQREHDVPGSMAPALYFQYLSDHNPIHLHGVYAHNEKDVLTLASLAVHFGKLLGGISRDAEDEGPEGEELFRTACWLEKHGNTESAERLFDLLGDREELGDGSGWSLALAARYKRAGQHERALPLWRKSAEKAENSALPKLDAHVELAIYYEHRDKQLLTALTYAEKALELAHMRARLSRDSASRNEEKEALLRRVTRLRDKVSRERM
ncbi:ribonuclease H-like domain-containing protein [Cohnella silvisoli]|uniref:Ribonuclease H-like domain-containing protein n=1 Tax=Cohnella silvisoli TaxID=2873699 RepID=A0ABV1KQD9_9BACL|nr:ribonuclease H-like domain-containing protein [Cohnella silvisoli]MCD9020999.1 ribonuclease H-like domain-containing protein [Cohnella silvisoli]